MQVEVAHIAAELARRRHADQGVHVGAIDVHAATVLVHQGTSGNLPLAAAFTVVPMLIMGVYLIVARRMGAFNAL